MCERDTDHVCPSITGWPSSSTTIRTFISIDFAATHTFAEIGKNGRQRFHVDRFRRQFSLKTSDDTCTNYCRRYVQSFGDDPSFSSRRFRAEDILLSAEFSVFLIPQVLYRAEETLLLLQFVIRSNRIEIESPKSLVNSRFLARYAAASYSWKITVRVTIFFFFLYKSRSKVWKNSIEVSSLEI